MPKPYIPSQPQLLQTPYSHSTIGNAKSALSMPTKCCRYLYMTWVMTLTTIQNLVVTITWDAVIKFKQIVKTVSNYQALPKSWLKKFTKTKITLPIIIAATELKNQLNWLTPCERSDCVTTIRCLKKPVDPNLKILRHIKHGSEYCSAWNIWKINQRPCGNILIPHQMNCTGRMPAYTSILTTLSVITVVTTRRYSPDSFLILEPYKVLEVPRKKSDR